VRQDQGSAGRRDDRRQPDRGSHDRAAQPAVPTGTTRRARRTPARRVRRTPARRVRRQPARRARRTPARRVRRQPGCRVRRRPTCRVRRRPGCRVPRRPTRLVRRRPAGCGRRRQSARAGVAGCEALRSAALDHRTAGHPADRRKLGRQPAADPRWSGRPVRSDLRLGRRDWPCGRAPDVATGRVRSRQPLRARGRPSTVGAQRILGQPAGQFIVGALNLRLISVSLLVTRSDRPAGVQPTSRQAVRTRPTARSDRRASTDPTSRPPRSTLASASSNEHPITDVHRVRRTRHAHARHDPGGPAEADRAATTA
jgi:hypothetical protein